ncbi:hypothetical protein [Bifidobacterium choerinum]|uniref:hypothetical protein n=1 Tax=Bifidobacterium choerinum TaxID=35760 RepID=UPI003F92C008
MTPWNTAKYAPVIHGSRRRMSLTCAPLTVPTASSFSETLTPMSRYFRNSTMLLQAGAARHLPIATASLTISPSSAARCARRVSAD